jgi:hypothetical protein
MVRLLWRSYWANAAAEQILRQPLGLWNFWLQAPLCSRWTPWYTWAGHPDIHVLDTLIYMLLDTLIYMLLDTLVYIRRRPRYVSCICVEQVKLAVPVVRFLDLGFLYLHFLD